MVLSESGLDFEFAVGTDGIKFDDAAFYRRQFSKISYAKGVDFVVSDRHRIYFIEVKNCLGHETENRWRIAPDNAKRGTAVTAANRMLVQGRESLDQEVADKITMTLACLAGASTFGELTKDRLKTYARENFRSLSDKEIFVILHLEGNFESKSRSKAMIMKGLQDSLRSKLRWLNCRVSVVDSNTCRAYKVLRS